MADNILIRDAGNTSKTMRTTDYGSYHVPHHMLDDAYTLTGPAAQSVANTDLLTGTVNGWFDAVAFFSGSIQIIGGAGITAGAVIFEGTNDASSTTGVAIPVFETSSVINNALVAATSIAASSRRIFAFPINVRYIRARISTAFAGGTVQAIGLFAQQPFSNPVLNVAQATATSLKAQLLGSIYYNDTTTALGASATFTGTSRDTGTAAASVQVYTNFRAYALASHAGTMRIECSNDNTNWNRMTADTAVAANTAVILTVPVLTRYHRVVFVNGATAQTSLIINSGYTAS